MQARGQPGRRDANRSQVVAAEMRILLQRGGVPRDLVVHAGLHVGQVVGQHAPVGVLRPVGLLPTVEQPLPTRRRVAALRQADGFEDRPHPSTANASGRLVDAELVAGGVLEGTADHRGTRRVRSSRSRRHSGPSARWRRGRRTRAARGRPRKTAARPPRGRRPHRCRPRIGSGVIRPVVVELPAEGPGVERLRAATSGLPSST